MKRKLKRYQTPRNGIQYIIDAETRKELSPFVFFDAGKIMRNDDGLFIGMHPHSGIGIITYFEGGDLKHNDTGGNEGIIKDGGIQWIQAGGGIFHQENYVRKDSSVSNVWPLLLYQLWMQLPPELEESEVQYENIQYENIARLGNIKVLVGSYKTIQSALKVPYNMTYLEVVLSAGESFEFETPKGQTTGFIFLIDGHAKLFEEKIESQKLNLIENNEGDIKVKAVSETKFILILVEPQEYPILTYGGSIHTNELSLKRSLKRINHI